MLIRQADAAGRGAARVQPNEADAWPTTRFTLTGDDLAALDAVGLRLAGLRYTRRLADRLAHRGADLDHLDGAARRLPRRRRLLQPLAAAASTTSASAATARWRAAWSIGPHEHPTDWLTTSRIAYYPEVNGWDALRRRRRSRRASTRAPALSRRAARSPTIGPDVWIGQGAFVKAGVTIGAGAIIGARATVLRDVPPYAIVVGTPGRVLRLRFPEATVERLLALAWWRYSIYDLFDAPMDSIDAALDVIEDAGRRAGRSQPYEGPVTSVPGPRRPGGAGGVADADAHGEGQLTGSRIRSRSGPTRQPGPSGISTR